MFTGAPSPTNLRASFSTYSNEMRINFTLGDEAGRMFNVSKLVLAVKFREQLIGRTELANQNIRQIKLTLDKTRIGQHCVSLTAWFGTNLSTPIEGYCLERGKWYRKNIYTYNFATCNCSLQCSLLQGL